MGTSSSYKGSSGKIPKGLRDGLDDWADSQSGDAAKPTRIPENVVAQALRIPKFTRGSSGEGGGGGAGGGGAAGGAGGGKQSSPQRMAKSYSGTASRAAALASAFRSGDREELEKAGLNFDDLSKLPSRAELVRAIVDVVCEAQSESTIPNEEQRAIAGQLVDWVLDDDQNQSMPDAEATARYAIGLIAREIFLTEAGPALTGRNGMTRDEIIAEVNETSQALAARANLSASSADASAIAKAIEQGIRNLRTIYKAGADSE